MGFVHDLPQWLVGVATVAVFVIVSLFGLGFSRRLSRRRSLHALVDNGVIGWIFSAILGIYAIAIGLIAVASWGNASSAWGAASREAAEIAALYRDLGGYPAPLRDTLQGTLAGYTRNIIDDAWPKQRRGEIPHEGSVMLSELTHALYGFEPATQGQQVVHAETLHAFNRLIEARRQRLEAVTYAVPGALWSVVLIGGLLSIVASYVFSMESFLVHGTMTSLLAAMVGLLVFFILITDLPYRGRSSLGPDSYELIVRDLMEKRPAR